MFLTINITISQSVDYQSTAFSTLCPLICKSITIARTQDLSPSPSVLCLQPGRRLSLRHAIFAQRSRVLDQATLPPVFSTNSRDYNNIHGHRSAAGILGLLSPPLSLRIVPLLTATRDNDKGMFQRKCGSEWQTPHSSHPIPVPCPSVPARQSSIERKVPTKHSGLAVVSVEWTCRRFAAQSLFGSFFDAV